MLVPPVIFVAGGGSTSYSVYQNTALQCTTSSTVPQTATVDWSTTALSANISNREANVFGISVNELLYLTKIDSGYCGEYTCTNTDSDMIPYSASIYLSIGTCLYQY